MKLKSLLLAIVLFCSVPTGAFAGSLDSSAAPGATDSFTLEDLYNRLDAGTDGAKGKFAEPAAVPGATGHTLNQIMEKAPAKDNTDGAAPDHVTKDKTFWGLTDAGWGLQTGTYEGGGSTPTPTCSGTLNGTRWCDNGNGTVTDMTTGLVWLQNANCTDTLAGISGGELNWEDALIWSSVMKSGSCGLTDSSEEGDWRLPTENELAGITQGDEAVSSGEMRAFTGVQTSSYWSSTSVAGSPDRAWIVYLGHGYVDSADKAFYNCLVWPVRAEQ